MFGLIELIDGDLKIMPMSEVFSAEAASSVNFYLDSQVQTGKLIIAGRKFLNFICRRLFV